MIAAEILPLAMESKKKNWIWLGSQMMTERGQIKTSHVERSGGFTQLKHSSGS